MSKRALKKYLADLPKVELEEQILDLYDRFPSVKKYYNFVFNPKEDKMLLEAKMKISNEYFPVKRKRPRARRSVAHKYIRNFLLLGVDPLIIADLMLYNLEVAMTFEKERRVPDAFYKSMLNSFSEAIKYISYNAILPEFKSRVLNFYEGTRNRDWPYREGFSRALDVVD